MLVIESINLWSSFFVFGRVKEFYFGITFVLIYTTGGCSFTAFESLLLSSSEPAFNGSYDSSDDSSSLVLILL